VPGNTCPVCGKAVPRRCLTYCGKECYRVAREKRVAVNCYNCGCEYGVRPFEKKRSATHYCPDCRHQWSNRQVAVREPTGYTLNCYWCGSPIYRPRWYARRYLYSFCTKECRRAGWRSLRLAHEGLSGRGT
jgi:hypothetical protein